MQNEHFVDNSSLWYEYAPKVIEKEEILIYIIFSFVTSTYVSSVTI